VIRFPTVVRERRDRGGEVWRGKAFRSNQYFEGVRLAGASFSKKAVLKGELPEQGVGSDVFGVKRVRTWVTVTCTGGP